MIEIVVYEAVDGSRFDCAEECKDREVLIGKVEDIEQLLIERPKGVGFSNGNGYLQHKKGSANAVMTKLLELCRQYSTWQGYRQEIDRHSEVYIRVGWIIKETPSLAPILKVWWRLSRIGKGDREYGTVALKENPYSCKQICLSHYND